MYVLIVFHYLNDISRLIKKYKSILISVALGMSIKKQ